MQIAPVATGALGELAKKLLEVCKNPMQPHFNHFLFESVAALIHFGENMQAKTKLQTEQCKLLSTARLLALI